MVSLLTVFLTLTVAYIAVLLWIAHKGSERFQIVGPLLMVRTQAGKKLIDRLAKRKWWGPAADVFLALTILAGLLMLVLVVWQNTLLFTHTEAVRENPPQVEQTLAIPGVNPVIPVGYGLFALIVALIIHEGGHGILCRFANLRVKSLGLLFLVIPVGAFVEPDEAALQGARLRAKLRMFASGPGPNIVLALVCVVLFSQVMIPALAPAHDGVAIMSTSEGLPAASAGLEAGTFVLAMNGTPTPDLASFQSALNQSRAGEPLHMTIWQGGEERTLTVNTTLEGYADKYDYYQQRFNITDDAFRNKTFLGVSPRGPSELTNFTGLFSSPFESQGVARGSLFYLALPFVGLQPFPTAFHDVFEPTGVFDGWGIAFWITANTLYWLFWLNIVLGTFNALPMGPLDGGHMFRHSVHTWLRRRRGINDRDIEVLDPEDGSPSYIARDPDVQDELDKVDRTTRLANAVLGWSLLALILAPLIVPQFL